MTILGGGTPNRPDSDPAQFIYYPRPPWWDRLLSTMIQLVTAPGWQGTLKLALLAVLAAGIYIVLHLLVV